MDKTASAFIGQGKSEELKNPKDGWIMKQIEFGKPIPGVSAEQGIDSIRFASRINKIASAIGEFNIKRSFHRKNDGLIAFFYSIKGSFEHATIQQIALVKELLFSKFTDDYETLFFESEPTLKRALQAKISLQHSTVYIYFEVMFAKDWTPGEGFWEV